MENLPALQTWRTADVARRTLVIVAVVLGFALLIRLRQVALALFLCLLIATLLMPAVDWMQRRGLRRSLGAILTLGLVLTVLGGLIWFLTPLVLDQVLQLQAQLPIFYRDLHESMLGSRYYIVRQFAWGLPPYQPSDRSLLEPIGEYLSANLNAIGSGVLGLLMAPLFVYFWLIYRNQVLKGVQLVFPLESRTQFANTWERIEHKVGAFLRAQFLLAVSVALLSLVGYWIAGVPYALLLALIAGLLELIPFIGPLLTAIVAVVVALSVDPSLALNALLAGVVVQTIENNLLVPRVMKQTLGIGPIVTLLAIAGLSALFGTLGLIAAIPLAAVVEIIVGDLVRYRNEHQINDQLTGRGRIDRLRYELYNVASDIRRLIVRRETHDAQAAQAEELEAIVSRLDRTLIRKAREDA
ncbi:MAG: AI-2E family transporter [Oscillochloris sp.]|nr:AI-2E family transporter [Oscillochloris sp.]